MKQNKRILVVGQFPPPYHGSNVMATIMVKTLKDLGYSVCFINKKLSVRIEQIGKINLNKIFRIPVLAVEVLITCLKKRPSICIYFLAVGKPAFFLDYIYLYIVRKCKVSYFLRFGGKGYALLEKKGIFWKKLVGATLSNANGGIVLGEKLRFDVNSHIKDYSLLHVPNCISEPSDCTPIRNDEKLHVLFLSNLIPSKGVMEVLKAAKIVLKEKEIYFTLAGSFSSKKFGDEIRSYIDNNDIGKYINLPGRVVGNDKSNAFRSSDIFVFPTYYELETFGIVNIEAMSYGLPVITSTEAAIPEIVQNGVSGFIVNPKSPEKIAEKILLLAGNPTLRKKMGDKGKEIFKRKYDIRAHEVYLNQAVNKFFKLSMGNK